MEWRHRRWAWYWVVSEDALRRALSRLDETAGAAWLCPALMGRVQDALEQPWILDIDASIKPLYGRQEGAEIGYNPHKPGRPSHVLHTYWVGNLRLVLDVQVSPGKQHTSAHAKAGLGRGLDELKNQWGLGGFTTQDIALLPDDGTGRRAGLQLVELVLSGRPSRYTSRSGDKPAPTAGGGRHDGQPRRTDAAISHAVACEG